MRERQSCFPRSPFASRRSQGNLVTGFVSPAAVPIAFGVLGKDDDDDRGLKAESLAVLPASLAGNSQSQAFSHLTAENPRNLWRVGSIGASPEITPRCVLPG